MSRQRRCGRWEQQEAGEGAVRQEASPLAASAAPRGLATVDWPTLAAGSASAEQVIV